MAEVVLDASVLLVSILREPGHENIAPLLDRARMSSVNLAEVVTKLTAYGLSIDAVLDLVDDMEMQIEPLDKGRAVATGLLTNKTSRAGLSLGDRACLSLAGELGLTAVTADKAWAKVDVGVEVQTIR
ncbi:MAG: type II toxin-antitoxin system VapC family toxin [Parvibaculum sp.]|uniref:PIN domain-containing protein n=1 Tax=Parvibaculum sp. TaxID=2024848 RepID=UPI00271E805B|nr:type II toxin-antitoxin system VapC family toxin [Parvibaculum sp.]MDO8839980.1 type II toxin-antitoxin system VapC family toxin [Parvibaculum sp.]